MPVPDVALTKAPFCNATSSAPPVDWASMPKVVPTMPPAELTKVLPSSARVFRPAPLPPDVVVRANTVTSMVPVPVPAPMAPPVASEAPSVAPVRLPLRASLMLPLPLMVARRTASAPVPMTSPMPLSSIGPPVVAAATTPGSPEMVPVTLMMTLPLATLTSMPSSPASLPPVASPWPVIVTLPVPVATAWMASNVAVTLPPSTMVKSPPCVWVPMPYSGAALPPIAPWVVTDTLPMPSTPAEMPT